MLSFFRQTKISDPAYKLYSAIVAQSRQPVFYTDMWVPDTVTGRFDMISMHLCLTFWHIQKIQDDKGNFSQQMFDLFFMDMDKNLRELGIGDTSVPKKIKKMGQAFYALLALVAAALENRQTDDDASARPDHQALLAEIYARNFFAPENNAAGQALADYSIGFISQLEQQSFEQFRNGTATFDQRAA